MNTALTQDSLIPDLLNGQAWNAYAYVYNDTINLVDPSGHMGVGGVEPIGGPIIPLSPIIAWKGVKNIGRWGSQGVLDFLDWYHSKPDCSCDTGGGVARIDGPVAGTMAQVAWGAKSVPAGDYGTYTVQVYTQRQITSWWRKIPGMQSRLANKIIPRDWGFKTVGEWKTLYQKTGWIDDIVPSGLQKANGTYTHPLGRYKVDSSVQRRPGWLGYKATMLFAGLIDGAAQWFIDRDACMSRAEKVYRIAMSVGLGMLGGAIGAAVFTIVAASASIAILPVLAGIAAGLVFVWAIDVIGVKERLFSLVPD